MHRYGASLAVCSCVLLERLTRRFLIPIAPACRWGRCRRCRASYSCGLLKSLTRRFLIRVFLQVETLSTMPRIHRVEALLTAAECLELVELARGMLVRSGKAPDPAGGGERSAWSAGLCGKGCAESDRPAALTVSS